MFPDWLTGFPYSVMHSLNLDWLLKKVASIDPSGFVRSINTAHKPDPETGNVTLTALNVGALPLNNPAVDAIKLDGKEPAYYSRVQNLLLNSNFAFPVNQRGLTTYSGAGAYTIDGWYIDGANKNMRVENGFIQANTTGGTAYATICQKVLNIKEYAGRVLTFAAYVQSNVIPRLNIYNKTASFEVASGTPGTWQIIACKFLVPSDVQDFDISVRIQAQSTAIGDYVAVKWACLYEGEYTTENLPTYVPPVYDAELLLCQRYLLHINCKNKPLGFGHAFTGTAIRVLIPTPASMSTAKVPSITFFDNDGAVVSANAVALIASAGELLTPSAVTSDGVARENGIIALCTVSSATNYETADLYCNGIVEISVEP